MISLIVAIAENNVIGSNNSMPWHLPDDLKRFKSLTMGGSLIMGRKTWESLPVKPLKGRRNIVLTRNVNNCSNCEFVASDAEEAIAMAEGSEIFIIGGAEIYRMFLPVCDRLYITRIYLSYEGDTFFPELDPLMWKITDQTDVASNSHSVPAYSYITYDRCL